MEKLLRHERLKIADGKSLTVETHRIVSWHSLHWHSFFEIEIILSGTGKYIVNDIEYDISKNNVFFLTSTDFHYLDVDGVADVINISFDETMISEKDIALLVFSGTQRAYEFSKEEYGRLVNAARILENECEIGGECQKQLLQYVIRCLLRKNDVLKNADVRGEHLVGIKKAIVYMELHFRENLTLDLIAKEAGYHPTYFSKLFKNVTGESYIETLTKLRLGYARTLLANGFSVSGACYSSGFGSLSNFLEIFKKNYNISPSEYKKMYSSK